MNKVIALVGMPGAGKTEVAKVLQQGGFAYLRFGQIVLDEALRRGRVDEETEREIRNDIRAKLGMGAMALLNLSNIEREVSKGNVVIDDLYSWEEYKILKEKYTEALVVLAICVSPKIRYQRLINRHFDPEKDKLALYRPYTLSQAKSRDFSQIEELYQGGPIAMADFYIVNEGSLELLHWTVDKFLENLMIG